MSDRPIVFCRPLLIVSAALVMPVAAQAQDAAPSIVVTGRALPDTPATPAYDTIVIPRDQLVASASGRIEDALSSVAGFQQFRRADSRASNPSAQGATLRALGGNATSRALVLLDGVPMSDPMFGYIPFSAIDPGRLSDVRVTRGGGSGAFGAGAVAGIISMTSAGSSELGPVSAEALIGNRGETSLSATLAPHGEDSFGVISGRWDRGRGFWTTPRAQRGPASVRARYDSWSASVRGVAAIAPGVELQARGLAFADHRVLRFAGANTGSSGQDGSLRLVGRGKWQFDVLAYVQARDFYNVVISSSTFRPTLDQKKTPSMGYGGKLEVRPPLGSNMVLKLGADWRLSAADLAEDANNASTGALTAQRMAGGRNSDFGFFAEDDLLLGPVTLTGGVRADHWSIRDGYFRQLSPTGAVTIDNRFADRSGWATTLRGGAVVALTSAVKVRAAAYSGLRIPTLNELYRPFAVFPVTTQANASLRNERLEGYEAGLDLAPSPNLTFAITAFDNRIRDAVANVTIGTNLRQRQNVDAIRARGIEAGGHVRVGKISFDGSLAWTVAKVEASGAAVALDGKRPAQTPRLSGTATLAWEPRERARLAATLRHVGGQYEDDLETDLLAAATTLDAFAQWPLTERLDLILRAENLTDATVVTRNQAGSIDLGAPRTLWAGVRVGF